MTPRERWWALRSMQTSFAALPAWLGLVTALRAWGPATWWRAVDLPLMLVCHRRPERVPVLAGVPLPLCSRCLGLWLGLTLGACVGWPDLPVRWLRRVVPGAVALMLIEIATQDLGWHPVWHSTRFLSGLLVALPLGGALGAQAQRELGWRHGH